jgi:GxxExxY protein
MLSEAGIRCQCGRTAPEVMIDLFYKGQRIGRHRFDLIVDETVILEIKSSESLPASAKRQCLSYLRASGRQVGLVLHFGPEPRIKRVIGPATHLGPDTEVVIRTSSGPEPNPFTDIEDPDAGDDATGSPL